MTAIIGILAGKRANIATHQWSQLLKADSSDHSATISQHRQLAEMLDKGDGKELDLMAEQNMVVWAPTTMSH